MPELPAAIVVPLGFVSSVLALAWLSRQISIHIQIPVYYLTRSENAPTLALFLIFLPGVLIHEGAHWAMARLCGLRTGQFRVWPKRQGKHIGLGSVNVQSAGPFVDSLIGMAPLIAGTILIGLISHFIFKTYHLTDILTSGSWSEGVFALRAALTVPDGLLWGYLLFTIANAMMPSASDREPLKPVIMYSIVGVALYVLLGLPVVPLTRIISWALPTLEGLTSAFVFTVILDASVLAVLFLIRILFRM
jgi:hypothetical protein